ncbi:MAG: H-X9-DG-CTERM domain-containing protein [Bryobacteraceae bacterium]
MVEVIAVVRFEAAGGWNVVARNSHPGKVHFALADGDGRPSRVERINGARCPKQMAGRSRGPPAEDAKRNFCQAT